MKSYKKIVVLLTKLFIFFTFFFPHVTHTKDIIHTEEKEGKEKISPSIWLGNERVL